MFYTCTAVWPFMHPASLPCSLIPCYLRAFGCKLQVPFHHRYVLEVQAYTVHCVVMQLLKSTQKISEVVRYLPVLFAGESASAQVCKCPLRCRSVQVWVTRCILY